MNEEARLKVTEKTASDSQAAPASGQSFDMADEYRFISKNGGYVTPWRSVPKEGIVGAIHKLKPAQRVELGEGYGLQLRKLTK